MSFNSRALKDRRAFDCNWLSCRAVLSIEDLLIDSLAEYLTHVRLVMKISHRVEKMTLKNSSFDSFTQPIISTTAFEIIEQPGLSTHLLASTEK